MASFEVEFSEPVTFSEGELVISRNAFPAIQDAQREFERFLECPINPKKILADFVRKQFTPAWLDSQAQTAWVGGASGRGAMPVWIYWIHN